FTIPATQTSISKGQWIEYHPISNITDSGPIEFFVSGTGDEYLDLARTQLFVKAKITKANGTAIDADTQVGPVNLFLHSLFSQVDITLGKMDVANPVAADDAANKGLKVRYDFTKESHIVDMMGPIRSDIFFQDRLMLDGVSLRIKLNRAKNSFCLMSSAAAPTFKVVITEAILFVRPVKLASSIILGHAPALK
ncbi:unnamed protein product, partial [Porites evermanni]